eukprot:snap_masked-scaffold_10-processed-gene-13.16-mRNA-1 protein AED:1.00 eAED:1.00 QI:0/0/0/0/1/1/2/0/63
MPTKIILSRSEKMIVIGEISTLFSTYDDLNKEIAPKSFVNNYWCVLPCSLKFENPYYNKVYKR